MAKAGFEVSGLARGLTLSALTARGLGFSDDGGEPAFLPIRASDDARDLGVQDLVVLAVKEPSLTAAVGTLKPLLGPDTLILPAMNGVPWWYFHGFGGKLVGRHLESIDPEGRIASAIPAESVIGAVVHFGASCPRPGVVKALPLRKLILGELHGRMTERLEGLGAAMEKGGIQITLSGVIQRDVWYKLWGNMTMNPLSALTGATMDRILDDPIVADFCGKVMNEARRVGAGIGCPIEQTVEDRFAVTRQLGAFKTSMLQDVESRRPVELDALLGAAVEIAGLLGEPVPHMNILLGLARLQARTLGLYPQA